MGNARGHGEHGHEHAHAHGLGEQRNQLGPDLECPTVDADPPVGEPVEQGFRSPPPLPELDRPLPTPGRKGSYVACVVEQRRKREIEVRVALELRGQICDEASALQIGDPGSEAQRMGPAKEVKPAEVERDARAKSGFASRRLEARTAASDPRDFRAQTTTRRILRGFFQLE